MTMQLGMFGGSKPFKIDKPVRLIELFAGIGSQAKALERLNWDFEHYRVCEFDKYAVKSYNAIHGTNFETSDITQMKGADLKITDIDNYIYIMTYSFPCQDLSKAGQGAGMEKGSGTRSGLLWEVERLLNETEHLPQVLLMENVPDVVGTKNMPEFAKWLEFLESKGYKCYWDKLNAKDYGMPQNRDRCFMVSILGDYYYTFPNPKPLQLRLKDILEDDVDEKYYLSDKLIKFFTFNSAKQKANGNGFKFEPTDGDCTAKSITTRAGGRMDDNFIKCEVVGDLNSGLEMQSRVYGVSGLSPTLNTCNGGNHEPKILEPLAYDEQNQTLRTDGTVGTIMTGGSSPKHNNRVVEFRFFNQAIETAQENDCDIGDSINAFNKTIDKSGVSPTITTRPEGFKTAILPIDKNYRIRKLTPKECWRLMGFDDTDFDKAQNSGMSNSQLYKQAGNSIVVNVLEEIFRQML